MINSSSAERRIFALPRKEQTKLSTPFNNALYGLIEKATLLDNLNNVYLNLLHSTSDKSFEDKILNELGIELNYNKNDINKIPETGPLLIVCNHPYGAVEGVILSSIIQKRRNDYKILANYLLKKIPELEDRFIFVDPFNKTNSVEKNIKPLKDTIRYLKAGGVIAVFPSGEVSSFHLKDRNITDPKWNENIARIAQLTKVPVLTIHFNGSNSKIFQIAGMINPKFRTLLLPRELLNKGNQKISLSIGNVIPTKKITKFTDPKELTSYLRFKTYILANEINTDRKQNNAGTNADIATSPDNNLLMKEIEKLKPNQLSKSGDYTVYYAVAKEIPFLIMELGIAREETFRLVGEGTGLPMDLDKFDDYYVQLILWNHKDNRLAGAYRLGQTDRILNKYGKKGLYTSSLFKYSSKFFTKIGNALELGRSFVRAEYQKSFTPLLLLWKGIGEYVTRNPKYTVLFGPVSISDDYTILSQKLLMNFLIANHSNNNLKKNAKPRNKVKFKKLQNNISDITFLNKSKFDDVSSVISELEADGKSAPILLKQYIKLGGTIVQFNRDPIFSNVLDALIVVDLKLTPSSSLEPYFQKEGLKHFYQYNNITI
jgi:putative hemolysin